METSATTSLNNSAVTTPLSLEMSFNNAYLKPAATKAYYTPAASNGNIAATAATGNSKAEVAKAGVPRVIQYEPRMGTEDTAITVILEQAISSLNNLDEIRPMSICFGRLIVNTKQQNQHAPNAVASNNVNGNLMWITLVAKAPKFSDTGAALGESVPMTVCTYTSDAKDTVLDTISFGNFVYKRSASSVNEVNESARKRVASEDFNDGYQQLKRPHQQQQQQLDDEQQLFSQLLAPFDESSSAASAGTTSQPSYNFSNATTIATGAANTSSHPGQLQSHPQQHHQPHQTELQPYSSSLPSSLQPVPPVTMGNDTSGAPSNTSYLNYQHHYSPSTLSMSTHQQQLPQLSHPSPFQQHQQHQQQPYQYNMMSTSLTVPMGSLKAPSYYPSSTSNPNLSYAASNAPGPRPTASISAPTYYGQSTTPTSSSSYPYSNHPQQQQQQQYHYQHQPPRQASMSSSSTTHMVIPSVPMYDTNMTPFAGVLSKANLKIIGDLMEMTYGWTDKEWAHGRRLVQFWRRQHVANHNDGSSSSNNHSGNHGNSHNENEVECGFKAIDQEEYQQQRIRENMATKYTNSTTTTNHNNNSSSTMMSSTTVKKTNPLIISCIYWREHNDFYITSVDCIFLLEGLIGVEFTVEEKNRIRRNLEGFRPLTVSKCKPECSEFFKLIMGFPHPKPRNIEKDVKVFAWKTLPNALRKIIRKYTPSYSSTAVVNIHHSGANGS